MAARIIILKWMDKDVLNSRTNQFVGGYSEETDGRRHRELSVAGLLFCGLAPLHNRKGRVILLILLIESGLQCFDQLNRYFIRRRWDVSSPAGFQDCAVDHINLSPAFLFDILEH